MGSKTRRLYWTLGRIGVVILAIIWAYDWHESMSDIAAVAMASGLLAYIYSRRYAQDAYERGWLVYSQLAVAAATLVWTPDWTSAAFGLVILGSLSLLQLLEYKQSSYRWGFVDQIGLLPLVTLYLVIHTPYDNQYLAFIMTMVAVTGLGVRHLLHSTHRSFVEVARVVYVLASGEAIGAAFMTGLDGWVASIALIIAGVVFGVVC